MKGLRIFKFCLSSVVALSFLWVTCAQAAVKIKFKAFNPSREKQQAISIKQPLPEHITPDEVIDAGDLSVIFDDELERFVVVGEFEFEPLESRIFTIEIEDIWRLSMDDLTRFEDHMEYLVFKLKDTEHFETAQSIKKAILYRISFVKKSQKNATTLKERIGSYERSKAEIEYINNDINLLKTFVQMEKGK